MNNEPYFFLTNAVGCFKLFPFVRTRAIFNISQQQFEEACKELVASTTEDFWEKALAILENGKAFNFDISEKTNPFIGLSIGITLASPEEEAQLFHGDGRDPFYQTFKNL
jgi:hypothetical protein